MTFTIDEAKRIVTGLLKNTLSTTGEMQVSEVGEDELAVIRSSILFTDETTGREFSGLVHIFVSPRPESVAHLAGRLIQLHTPRGA